jgi:hypothetical protein
VKLGLLGSATGNDVLWAIAVTAIVESLGVFVLGLGHASDEALQVLPEVAWSVPVKLEEAPPPPPPQPEVEQPLIRNPKIKLGGGKPGGSVKRRPVTTPRKPRPLPPTPAPKQAKPIAAPPGPTTSAPLPTPLPPITENPELEDDIDYEAEPGEEETDAPPGEGFPDGDPEGTITDPLQAHAIRLYRGRIKSWVAARFKLTGTGLPQETLRKLRASASISVEANRRVSGYSMGSSGNAAFDAAVRRALETVKGLELPPPPQHYPGYIQGRINIEFVCGENTCD